jgi:CBS-domain-containing membrane protein
VTAGELMTAPAVTVRRFAPIASAARLMNTHHIRRLPVVDDDGKLIGIVTRRDLLSVFLRPDQDIAADVGELLDDVLHADPSRIKVVVREGRVILTGQPGPPEARDLITVAIRLIWDIDGVVDVTNRLDEHAAEPEGQPPRATTRREATGQTSGS